MLRIRDEQMRVFEEVAVRSFETRTIEYLKKNFPKHCELLGEEGVRDFVRLGWNRAKNYGLDTRTGVELFISLMFLLGSGFDSDPQLPWAAEILKDESDSGRSERLDRLFEKTTDYLDKVAGPKNEFIDSALRNLKGESLDTIALGGGSAFYRQLLARLNRIYPQKYEYLGELNLRRLIQRGIAAASTHGILNGRGAALYLGMMFMLGSDFESDPMFRWASKILNDVSLDEASKTERLYNEAISNLEKWLGHSTNERG